MDLDHLFFLIGILASVAFIFLAIYLYFSNKRARIYKKMIESDTETIDAYETTVSKLIKTEEISIEETLALGCTVMSETSMANDGFNELPRYAGFNPSTLKGKYTIEKEIPGGGMSRVFLVRSVKLGNLWILKYIDRKTGSLANEERILKLLNDISLPKIIDIFTDDNGIYIIQSFIEGISMDKVIKVESHIGQSIIIDWAVQLAQVLSYLHGLKPSPIVHCDLKPSNIMVTHGNKLVLIDFGISRQLDSLNEEVKAVSYKYAAPEQLKHRIHTKYENLIEERFGVLPQERYNWIIDERTDIYSFGVIVFELITGNIPTYENKEAINQIVSDEFCHIINKCLEINPDDRYQSVKDLLEDLLIVKDLKAGMVKTLLVRRIAYTAALILFLISGSSYAAGAYVLNQENLSLLYMEPDAVKISEQQSAEIYIQKIKPNGEPVILDPKQIKWTLDNNIAKIDGNRIVGMNVGETELIGKHRNKIITLNIGVVEKMDGVVDISLAYLKNSFVERYYGTGDREHTDGEADIASFVSPESITKTEDETVYLSDAGVLKKIKDGIVESIAFEPSYITPKIVRSFKNQLFILSNTWEDEDGYYYGIIRMDDNGVEGLYIADGIYTNIEDFAFSNDGKIYFIEDNTGTGKTIVKCIDLELGEISDICEVDSGSKGIAIDMEDNIYIAVAEKGYIEKINKDTFEKEFFAGIEGERHFIDGKISLFYEPQKIYYFDNDLYVLDFNAIRKITIEDGIATMVETIAGDISTDDVIKAEAGRGDTVVFSRSKETDFYIEKGNILITDPKNSIIWRVSL